MKRPIALLFCLLMITMPLAGCFGGDDDSSIVGDWYIANEVYIDFREDGAYASGGFKGPDDVDGTWSVDDNMLSIIPGDGEEIQPIQFTIDDNWLWMLIEYDGDKVCVGCSPDSMTQDEWDEKMKTITSPSFCDGAEIEQ